MKFGIIGNGVAGLNAARTLARSEPEATIDIYAEEPYLYYPRPRLLHLLAGEIQQEELYLYPKEWYEKRDIAVHLASKVMRIDPQRQRLTLADGRQATYERLLLAMGSSPIRPPIKGLDKAEAFTIRSLDDALAIRKRTREAQRAAVIGGGLLALEAAKALRGLGLQVTVVELLPRLLPKQLDKEGSLILERSIEALGIEVLLGSAVQEVSRKGSAHQLSLKDGGSLEADLLLICAGVTPNVQAAKEAGIEVQRGIVVDEHMRTSLPNIYAAGDVVQFEGRVYGIIPAALEQSRVAALNMSGQESVRYQGTLPATILKVATVDFTSVGVIEPRGEGYRELRKTDERRGLYKKLLLKEGRIVGAILLGDKKSVAPVSRLIKSGIDVSAYLDRLLDEDFDLKTLL